MDKWQRAVDQKLRQIIGDGDISHLPGAGKPLDMDEDCYTPADSWAASKIMRDNDVMPEWVASGKALDEREAKLRAQIQLRAARYKRDQSALHAKRIDSVEANWTRYQREFAERVDRYNRDALLHNLKAPRGAPHKLSLRAQALISDALE